MNIVQIKALITFELKCIPPFLYAMNIFIQVAMAILYSELLAGRLQVEAKPLVDILLLSALTINIFLLRPYSFTVQDVKSNFYVAPIQLLFRTMSFSKEAIIISRITTALILNFFSTVIFLSTFFIILPPHTIPNSVSFFLVWLFVVLGLSGINPSGETGGKFSKPFMIFTVIAMFSLFFLLITIVRLTTEKRVFEWLLTGVTNYPILLPCIMFLLAVLLLYSFVLSMKKQLNAVDYSV
ncbi:hypothetical protein [Alkalihalobacillus sp. LMS39]|uniref:hypothetical protein n=1 Tax=Alkalihalobacillus sp. LMS39 TaxID=2924032 RepID=UPI001FB553EC|nr:hypothetical protein [Alkalihalobacillus sp. LMS39]UOE96140.1 hypothetical protein MM271_11295 [Alkalihalobacillus sp. LMS39]